MAEVNQDRIKELEAEGMTRYGIAKATGVDVGHISRIFSGKGRPSLRLARMIALYLEMPVEELCNILGLNGIELKDNHRNNKV